MKGYENGYLDELWDEVDTRSRRHYLREFTDLDIILGWAEQAHGGWVAMVREDTGFIRRVGCVRCCQQDAIRAARAEVNVLRLEQIRKRKLYINEYPTFWKPRWHMSEAA